MRLTTSTVLLMLMIYATEAIASTPPKLIRLELATSNSVVTCTINNRMVIKEDLDRLLKKLAALDVDQTLMVVIDGATPVKALMDLVSDCRGKGFTSFRIFLVDNDRTTEISLGQDTDESPIEIIASESEGRL